MLAAFSISGCSVITPSSTAWSWGVVIAVLLLEEIAFVCAYPDRKGGREFPSLHRLWSALLRHAARDGLRRRRARRFAACPRQRSPGLSRIRRDADGPLAQESPSPQRTEHRRGSQALP